MRLQVSGGESFGNSLGYRAPLLDGERGTAQTVKLMRQLVDQAQADPQFVRFAIDLVRNVPAYDEFGEVSALFSWVQSNIRYTKDPVSKEKLYPPAELLKIGAGDCDDMSMLLAALATSLGYPARLITVGANPSAPTEFSHIYVEVECPAGSGNWVALDTARPESYVGRQPEQYFLKRAWSLTDDSYQNIQGATRLRGLSGYGMGMGCLGDGFDWNTVIGQVVQETPQIIAVAQGAPTTMRTPGGAVVSTGSPYSSFATPYTPGYAVPAAGYGALQGASSGIFSAALPWLLIGAVVLAVVKR